MSQQANAVLNAMDEARMGTVITLYDKGQLIPLHSGLTRAEAIESWATYLGVDDIPYWMAYFGVTPNKTDESEESRIDQAITLAVRYGGIDGAHHKTWVIDQMVRVLAGEKYTAIVTEACDGEDGPDTYEWDCGIAP